MDRFTARDIEKLADILRNDGVIAVPTDTVYGVCARMDSLKAQENLREVKNRPRDKAFPVMCADLKQIEEIAYVNEKAKIVMQKFMPGPITVILKKKEEIPTYVNGGMETLAIRMATSDVLHDLIQKCGFPLYMTSANQSGCPVAETLEEIEEACPKLDGILEGKIVFGQASTIVDLTGDEIRILRQGPIHIEQIKEELYERLSTGSID